MSASLVPADRIEFDAFARVCDLHPELLDRLVSIGLLEASADAEGRRWFERSQIAAVARIRRLRSGLRLSYSAIAVVAPLIDHLDELEMDLRRLEAEHHVAIRRWPCTPVEKTDP
jgi:DNA-binding transcriptional MerR regulator